MNQDFILALDEVIEEKEIDKEDLFTAIETSIKNAYQKNYKPDHDVDVRLDRETGEITVYKPRTVVEVIDNPDNQIALSEARKINESFEPGDIYKESITPKDFGRIAAQNAKQMIIQKIKEAEQQLIYKDFIDKEGELVIGTVSRVDRENAYINLGKVEAFLPIDEMLKNEKYRRGDNIKVYIVSVRENPNGPNIKVSRKHPNLVKRLFEEEIPEIYDGTVDIVNIVREAGTRTKVAVISHSNLVDAVGACIGQKGMRIQNILSALPNEKIDIIEYSDQPEVYLERALAPANIKHISLNEKNKTATVVIEPQDFSIAIGREGQNVRLAAKLTNWRIDLKTPEEFEAMMSEEEVEEKRKADLLDKAYEELFGDSSDVEEPDEYGDLI